MKNKLEERMDPYWICGECATARGWKLPDDYVGTVTNHICYHCGKEDTLYPHVDFDKGDGKPVHWD